MTAMVSTIIGCALMIIVTIMYCRGMFGEHI